MNILSSHRTLRCCGRMIASGALILFSSCSVVSSTSPTDLYVDASAQLYSDGSASRPFQSLSMAAAHIIQHPHPKGTRRTVWIRPGTYGPLSLNHTSLSGVHWRGVPGASKPVISGGVEVPNHRFKPWSELDGAYVASLAGLGADDLGGMKNSFDGVVDCVSATGLERSNS